MMDISVDVALGGVFGFRGHLTEIVNTTMQDAIKRLRADVNKPQSKGTQFIPGIDYVSPVERSSRFLFVRFLEGFKEKMSTILSEDEEKHLVVERIKVSVPIHKHLIDTVLFSKGATNDYWFFVQGDDVGDAFGRLNRYLQAVGYSNKVSIASFAGLPHPETVVQDILAFIYFHNLHVERISGIKIAGKRYSVMGTKVSYSGDFDLRRSEFADEINDKVRSGEMIEGITIALARGKVPASVGGKVPIFTIRNDLRISSRSKASDKTVRTAMALSNLLEECSATTFTTTIEMERKLSKSLVSLENFI